MYCNFAKNPGIPLLYSVSRCSSSAASSKLVSFSGGHHHNLCCGLGVFTEISSRRRDRCCGDGLHEPLSTVTCKTMKADGSFGSPSSNRYPIVPGWILNKRLVKNGLVRYSNETYGFDPVRFFSNTASQTANGNSRGGGKKLPWVAAYNGRKVKISGGKQSGRSSSSWEESANSYFSKKSSVLSEDYKANKPEKLGNMEGRNSDFADTYEAVEQAEDDEPLNDPRWDKIKSKYNKFVSTEARQEKPEVLRWNRQDNWGRKTWKESTESSVPKMVGEGVYGVSPVLAALSARRRDFYALYVQEGLESSSSGKLKKRKDKKAVEKILKMAETMALTVKQISKHDLNMIVDSRPHQGMVLDASPLEMVNIQEMDPVSVDGGDKSPLWIALDEVTDPQNFGAILRSAYFFGVKGVVVCAKNSAPLSGVVSKASVGALEMIELRSCKNMMKFLSSSVENGWRIIGGSVSPRAICLTKVQTGPPTILVLGNEGHGLRPLVERSCTELVKIPGHVAVDIQPKVDEALGVEEPEMDEVGFDLNSYHAVESLNVSVAAGVLLYHLTANSAPVVESLID